MIEMSFSHNKLPNTSRNTKGGWRRFAEWWWLCWFGDKVKEYWAREPELHPPEELGRNGASSAARDALLASREYIVAGKRGNWSDLESHLNKFSMISECFR